MSTIIRHDRISSSGQQQPAGAEATQAAAPADAALPEESVAATTASRLRRVLPTAAVVAALVGLAAWGHFSHWTMPKFSDLMGGAAGNTIAWCDAHNVPEDECIECHPDLLPRLPDFGWCAKHGVAQCPFEHPEVAQLKETPSIDAEMLARADRALALRPRNENNSSCGLHLRRVQFASTEALEKSGVDIALVEERPVLEAVSAPGEVGYDETRMAHLASRVSGAVWRVEKQVGDRVEVGDVLALVDSTEIGAAKSELLQAIAQLRLKEANVERLRPLAADGTVPGFRIREAEAAYDEARIRVRTAEQALVNLGLATSVEDFTDVDVDEIARRIRFLGLPNEMIAELDPQSTTSNLYPLRSPLAGEVVARHIVKGEAVDAEKVVFAVADTSRMWLVLNVKQEDAAFLANGQKVVFRANDAGATPEVEGEIAWISTAADEETRTVAVRAELPNADGRLRANTFGTGRVVLRDEPRTMVVPSEAIHWDGTCHVVFVRDKNYFQEGSPKFFHVRTVRPGVPMGDSTEIIVGLLPGEVVASRNSVVLQAQLLKSNLGAGCGCVDGH